MEFDCLSRLRLIVGPWWGRRVQSNESLMRHPEMDRLIAPPIRPLRTAVSPIRRSEVLLWGAPPPPPRLNHVSRPGAAVALFVRVCAARAGLRRLAGRTGWLHSARSCLWRVRRTRPDRPPEAPGGHLRPLRAVISAARLAGRAETDRPAARTGRQAAAAPVRSLSRSVASAPRRELFTAMRRPTRPAFVVYGFEFRCFFGVIADVSVDSYLQFH